MLRDKRDEGEALPLLSAPLLSPDDRSNATAPIDQPREDDGSSGCHIPNRRPNFGGSGSNDGSRPEQPRAQLPGVSVSVGSKAFFSNERTFLSWMNMAVMLSAVSVSVLALGAADVATELYGLLMLPVAVAFCVYALVMFVRRASFLRRRHPGPYDDKVGPVLLTLLLMASIVADMVIAVRHIRSR